MGAPSASDSELHFRRVPSETERRRPRPTLAMPDAVYSKFRTPVACPRRRHWPADLRLGTIRASKSLIGGSRCIKMPTHLRQRHAPVRCLRVRVVSCREEAENSTSDDTYCGTKGQYHRLSLPTSGLIVMAG